MPSLTQRLTAFFLPPTPGQSVARNDGWHDLFSAFGDDERDKLEATSWKSNPRLSRSQIEALVRGNGVARAIVERPANDATRRWVELLAADEVEQRELAPVAEALTRLPVYAAGRLRRGGARTAVTLALRYARQYGGAAILLGVDDGAADLRQPLRAARVRTVDHLQVLNRWEICPQRRGRIDGPVEIFEILSEGADGQIERFDIHASRVITFDGADVSGPERASNDGWGDPILQLVYTALRNDGVLADAAPRTAMEKNIGVYRFAGLQDLISSGGEGKVRTKMRLIARAKSVIGGVILDKDGEDFSYKDASMTGLAEALDTSRDRVSATARIPVAILYGNREGGLGDNGDFFLRSYYDSVESEIVELDVVPAVEVIAALVMSARQGPTGGRAPEGWRVQARSLWRPTEREVVETKKLGAEAERIVTETWAQRISSGMAIVSEGTAALSRSGVLEIDEPARAAAASSGDKGADLPALELVRQGRLLAEALYLEEEQANFFRRLIGMPDWTPKAREEYLNARALMGAPTPASTDDGQLDGETGDGTRVGLFLRLPPALASLRGDLEQDDSPAHVTFLVVGAVPDDRRALLLQILRGVFEGADHPFRAFLGELCHLVNRSGQSVFYQDVRFTPWRLFALREQLVERLRAGGFGLADVSPDCWLPHLTLAYDPDPAATFAGQTLGGSWHIGEVELWGFEEVIRLPLGPSAT